jgi:hypothetical protein
VSIGGLILGRVSGRGEANVKTASCCAYCEADLQVSKVCMGEKILLIQGGCRAWRERSPESRIRRECFQSLRRMMIYSGGSFGNNVEEIGYSHRNNCQLCSVVAWLRGCVVDR